MKEEESERRPHAPTVSNTKLTPGNAARSRIGDSRPRVGGNESAKTFVQKQVSSFFSLSLQLFINVSVQT